MSIEEGRDGTVVRALVSHECGPPGGGVRVGVPCSLKYAFVPVFPVSFSFCPLFHKSKWPCSLVPQNPRETLYNVPRFGPRAWRHKPVEFLVHSRPNSGVFFPNPPVFLPPQIPTLTIPIWSGHSGWRAFLHRYATAKSSYYDYV